MTVAERDETLGLWRNEIWETVQSSGPVSLAPQGILVLATERTKMPDILSGLKRYRRGWDIANPLYWTKRRSRSNEKMNALQNVVPNSNQVDINNFQTSIPLLQPPRHIYFLSCHLLSMLSPAWSSGLELAPRLSMLLIVSVIFCARESLDLVAAECLIPL